MTGLAVPGCSSRIPAVLLGCISFIFILILDTPASSARQSPQDSPSQSAPSASPTSTEQAAPAAATKDSPEVASHDSPASFKVRVNLVQVRVIVRDEKGNVVENLKKEDFRLFDGRKPQSISTFAVETPASRLAAARSAIANDPEAATGMTDKSLAAMPQRFVALLFDDIHLRLDDATFARVAATKVMSALDPSDRVGLYTTSGQLTQEFTNDPALLKQALVGIVPRPVTSNGAHDCPDIGYYQSHLIVNMHDEQALGVATEETIQCEFQGDDSKRQMAMIQAEAEAERTLQSGDLETEYAYRHMEDALRRLTSMPGQRVMVFVSPGFIMSKLFLESSDIIDQATKSGIVIDTVDARGLYAPEVLGDISNPQIDTRKTVGFKSFYRVTSQSAQSEILQAFAAGTGGTYFHDRNDVDEGLKQAIASPPVSYLLGFSPQNLKLDGGYHTLKVTMAGKTKYSVQARHGYFAPKNRKTPEETAKAEIQEAILSQEEINDLPVEIQTQFFKTNALDAKLAVLARVDVKSVRFKKEEGRNRNNLVLATAIFDQNGNYVTGNEKILEMRLKDPTLDKLSRSGLTVKSSFDVKPGNYLVRLVVREAEGELMAARNGTVAIPY